MCIRVSSSTDCSVCFLHGKTSFPGCFSQSWSERAYIVAEVSVVFAARLHTGDSESTVVTCVKAFVWDITIAWGLFWCVILYWQVALTRPTWRNRNHSIVVYYHLPLYTRTFKVLAYETCCALGCLTQAKMISHMHIKRWQLLWTTHNIGKSCMTILCSFFLCTKRKVCF